MYDFLLEVGGRFGQFGISGDIELAVVLDSGAAQAALPPLLVHPTTHGVRPVRAIGGDAVRDLESARIELEDGDPAEGIAVGIEELIVVDIGMLAKNPLAVGAKVGLRGLALDAVAQRVLTFVCVGEIELVGEEEHAGDQGGGDEDRDDDAVNTDAGGFDGRDFVGALQQAEGDQHRQQHAERRNRVVQEVRCDVEQIFSNRQNRHVVAQDIVEQLEERKYQQQHQESSDDQRQVERKVAQHIVVEDSWETKIE